MPFNPPVGIGLLLMLELVKLCVCEALAVLRIVPFVSVEEFPELVVVALLVAGVMVVFTSLPMILDSNVFNMLPISARLFLPLALVTTLHTTTTIKTSKASLFSIVQD